MRSLHLSPICTIQTDLIRRSVGRAGGRLTTIRRTDRFHDGCRSFGPEQRCWRNRSPGRCIISAYSFLPSRRYFLCPAYFPSKRINFGVWPWGFFPPAAGMTPLPIVRDCSARRRNFYGATQPSSRDSRSLSAKTLRSSRKFLQRFREHNQPRPCGHSYDADASLDSRVVCGHRV